ncbi:MAG: serine protein kinase PrkA [Sorangiineae bacterium]|nr:serine protein kinase PrkA [Polyangiaceae bacterium]MEB2321984.1 serine protein kinase PrkA [Sorangiineae bacterium]
MGTERLVDELRQIARDVQRSFTEERRLLSFQEYVELFATEPVRHSRDASRYLRDLFDHYGRATVERPWGTLTRFRLFDQPFLPEEDREREALVGQETVQAELYRILSNFVREGRPKRVALLHGPNGSAKSTIAACIMRALEHYSALDEGALYRFHWVFPNQTRLRGAIGFGGGRPGSGDDDSYAHLPDDQLDARLFMEVRDHPLFLVPRRERARLLERLYEEAQASEPPPAWILHGSLSHKSQLVYEALLASYGGNLDEVFRHVQVERYFISRRYRVGAVTLGPELSVDAGERQVTADHSLGALPASLKSVTLFEVFGELIDAAGGVLEFSDLLKRPLDAFKYLQITAETGEVGLRSQTVQINCVMLASGNELHLSAFREHPEFESFRGRLELVRTPYLLSWNDEQRIYDLQIAPQAGLHVAPHATEVAARFAVLTRMRRPDPEQYEGALRSVVGELTAFEKLELYASGGTPPRLDAERSSTLRAGIARIRAEADGAPIYEGSSGASPREMRALLLDAAQSTRYSCLSPFAVLDELDRLCARVSEYSWLEEERQPGGYHDHVLFRELLREHLLDALEGEFRVSSGLVDEARYDELFDRYITHVSFWVKGEKLRNPLTGQYEEPSESLMQEVESLLGTSDEPRQLRHSLISRAAAWAIEHPGAPIDNATVFAPQLRSMREAVFEERRSAVARLCRDVVIWLRGDGSSLAPEAAEAASRVVEELRARFGYEESSAGDAAVALMRERFAELLA